MNEEKLYTAEYTPEAKQQFLNLEREKRIKIASAIEAFEKLGTKYKNINRLDFDLFEIKPKGIRAYFKYDKERRRINNRTCCFKENSESAETIYGTSRTKYK